MDLNSVLIWLVAGSCIIQMVALRSRSGHWESPWHRKRLFTLIALAIAYVFVPDWAGYIALPIWVVIELLPLGFHAASKLCAKRQWFGAGNPSPSLE